MDQALRWGLLTLVVLALGYLGIGLFVANRLLVTTLSAMVAGSLTIPSSQSGQYDVIGL